MAFYDGYGNTVNINTESGGVSVKDVSPNDYDRNVKAVNHRGYNSTAPENTLAAYRLSKKNGFYYVETDVRFTSDGIPVLLHDASINRTARNADGTELTETVNIAAITYEESQTYDFGIWFSEEYAGAKIPTFEEFMLLCRNIVLHPYVHIKQASVEQLQLLIDIIESCGMRGKVTWVGDFSILQSVKNIDSSARLGLIGNPDDVSIANVQSIKTGKNEVFFDTQYVASTIDGYCELAMANGIPLEIWTVDSSATITEMNPYISGVTGNSAVAGKILQDANKT